MVDVETKLFCETSDASPNQQHILHNANTLYTIGDTFCCQEQSLPAKCTKMGRFRQRCYRHLCLERTVCQVLGGGSGERYDCFLLCSGN
jgi:hypothetical protein